MSEMDNRMILKLVEILTKEKLITPEEKLKLYGLILKEGSR